MRITGSNSSTSPTLSKTGTYKFKIAANGIVTKKETYGNITGGLNTESMTELFNDYLDDESYHIDMDGDSVSFLGNTYSQLYVSGNGGFSFGLANDKRTGNNDPITDNGLRNPCIYMVNNDASLEQVWATSFDSGTTFAYKIMGNTNYDNSGVNYEYDIYFYSNGTVDVFVVQESTDWNDYADPQGEVQWGVTNGTNWVDGYTNHFSSFGASPTGLRVTGGLRLVGSAPVVGSSFTILETDFTASAFQGPGIIDYGQSIGLLSTGAGNVATAQYGISLSNFTAPKLAEIQAYFMTNSLVNDGSLGYNFSVVGSGVSNITKIVLGVTSTDFIIAPANFADANFTNPGGLLGDITSANYPDSGILAFPVTFTLDSPLITHPGSWW